MDTLNFNRKRLDTYWNLLKNLSNEAKLELASLLINSVRKPPEKEESKSEILDRLTGAWADDNRTAEEIIEDIRSSRLFNRKNESLD